MRFAATPAVMEQEKIGQGEFSLNEVYKINITFCYLLCIM